MRSGDITKALGDVGGKWTRQIKAEEKRPSARTYRDSMWTVSRISLKEICFDHMEKAWNKASNGGRLPTHWRQIFYVMRPICDEHPESDRPLRDTTFKQILECYLEERHPGWDVLRGARGVFKEPHAAENDSGVAMSTMNVRNYLGARSPDSRIEHLRSRFPTKGARNRIAAVLICEKEGFDELLEAENIPAKFDLALMSTKGISAIAARDLADGLGVPCFTLHDLDKNGFVMAGGFRLATDIGIRMADVEKWGLASEDQSHANPEKTRRTVLRNGGTSAEAEFISSGQRVELNMFTSVQLVGYVTEKLKENGVEKVIPDQEILRKAWTRAHLAQRVNELIDAIQPDDLGTTSSKELKAERFLQVVREMPEDLAGQIGKTFEDDPTRSWDEALWDIIGPDADGEDEDEDPPPQHPPPGDDGGSGASGAIGRGSPVLWRCECGLVSDADSIAKHQERTGHNKRRRWHSKRAR